MAKAKEIQLTKKGLEELQKELDERRTVIKKQLQDELDDYLADGDITENQGYYRVQDEIASNDKRIEEIEELIENAVVVKENECGSDSCKIGIGNTVVLKKDGKETKFTLVGATEADTAQNKISIESPIGMALAGKKKGDQVTVRTPMGSQKYDIIDIL